MVTKKFLITNFDSILFTCNPFLQEKPRQKKLGPYLAQIRRGGPECVKISRPFWF